MVEPCHWICCAACGKPGCPDRCSGQMLEPQGQKKKKNLISSLAEPCACVSRVCEPTSESDEIHTLLNKYPRAGFTVWPSGCGAINLAPHPKHSHSSVNADRRSVPPS